MIFSETLTYLGLITVHERNRETDRITMAISRYALVHCAASNEMCQAVVCISPTACGRLVTLQWTRPPPSARYPAYRSFLGNKGIEQNVTIPCSGWSRLYVVYRIGSHYTYNFQRGIPSQYTSNTPQSDMLPVPRAYKTPMCLYQICRAHASR